MWAFGDCMDGKCIVDYKPMVQWAKVTGSQSNHVL